MLLHSLSNQPLKCCITKRVLTSDDNIVCFPMFVNEPHVFPRTTPKDLQVFYNDPVVMCNESCALRSAFDEWEFKEMIVQKVKETWITTSPSPPYRNVLWKDDNYLIIHLPMDSNRIKVFFLKKVFILSCSQSQWNTFCDQVQSKQKNISLKLPNGLIRFIQSTDHITIFQKPLGNQINSPHQSIDLTIKEGREFKSIMCSDLSLLP